MTDEAELTWNRDIAAVDLIDVLRQRINTGGHQL